MIFLACTANSMATANDVVAIIISYNPDIDRLRQNVSAVAGQVSCVLIFDNKSENWEDVASLDGEGNCAVVFNDENSGLPVSLNEGCRRALRCGARYALLLDQDSVASEGMVASLAECMCGGVAVASPQIIDRNKHEAFVPADVITPVKRVITSGALVSLDAWHETDGFDERIFVDWADYEFCANLRFHGYKIVRDMRTMIRHEMGRREYAFTLPAPKGGRPFYRTNHSKARLKDKARSWAIVKRKYGCSKAGREERAYIAAIELRDLVLERGRVGTLRAFREGAKEGKAVAKAERHG